MLWVYGKKTIPCSTLDKLRYVLASTTDKSAAELPPTEDAFMQHVMKARYQVAIWCQSHIANPVLWELVGNGCKLLDGEHLEPVQYTKDVAPLEVRDLTHLYCKDHDCRITWKCQCLQTGLKCTEFCACSEDCCNSVPSEGLDSDDAED